MKKHGYYFGRPVLLTDLNDSFDWAEAAQREETIERAGTAGAAVGMSWGAHPTQQSVPDLTVAVPAGVGYDSQGRRCYVPTPQTLDCSQDALGVSTAVVGAGNEKWLSIYLRFSLLSSDRKLDSESVPAYFTLDEGFTFAVLQAAEAVVPTATREAISAEAGILLADVHLIFGQTTIATADISFTRRQSDPYSALAGHFAGTSQRHAAADVDGAAISGSPSSLTADTAQAMIGQILTLINARLPLTGGQLSGALTCDGTPRAIGTDSDPFGDLYASKGVFRSGDSGPALVARGNSGAAAEAVGLLAGHTSGGVPYLDRVIGSRFVAGVNEDTPANLTDLHSAQARTLACAWGSTSACGEGTTALAPHFNVATVTRNNAGSYTFEFDVAPSANFCVVPSVIHTIDEATPLVATWHPLNATTFLINVTNANTNALADARVSFVVFDAEALGE